MAFELQLKLKNKEAEYLSECKTEVEENLQVKDSGQ